MCGRAWLILALCGLSGTALADRILIMGDSLSAAYQMPPEQGWVHLLGVRLDRVAPGRHDVINASVSGESTTGALARLPAQLAQSKPDIVVFELGANDALQGQPMHLISQNFRQLIQLAKAAGARVAILGVVIPAPYNKVDAVALADLYRHLARESGATLQPSFLEGISGQPALLQWDGLHPNARAQSLILERAWLALQPLLRHPPSSR